MTVNNNQKKQLLEMIEQILLNGQELDTLKVLINELSMGKINSKQLKVAIIKSRATALKRIFDIFPFYHKRIANQQEIEKFTEKTTIEPEILQELEEKNNFLEEIGVRVNKIIQTLKE